MLKHTPFARGMTLLELMVGITVVAILLTLALPNFSALLQAKQIRAAATSLQNGLQLARAEALRRNHPVAFAVASHTGWSIGCVPADSSCPATIQAQAASEGSAAVRVSARNGANAELLTDGSGEVLVFAPLGQPQGASLPITLSITMPDAGACLANSGDVRCLRVEVRAGGASRVCDPDPGLGSDNPGKCS